VVAGLAALLLWNAHNYFWERSYDAFASRDYIDTLTEEHRLPHESETTTWHNPPLFYVIAGQLQRIAPHIGYDPRERLVQVMSALCVLGIVVLAGLIARELFPSRPWVWVLTVVAGALTPVLVRAGSLYHPEPLAAVLTTAGLYVVVRLLARESRWVMRPAVLAAVLLSLANLTRTWALAAVAAAVIALFLRGGVFREPPFVRAGVVVACVTAVLTGPWFVVKAIDHGSPLAYSQPNPKQWLERGRPLEFWFGFALPELFSTPYQPAFRNHLVPTVYADWWGDYWRVYGIPIELLNTPDVLPSEYAQPRRTQMWVGLAGSAAALAGFILLARHAVRRRDLATGAVLLALTLLAVSYVGFLWRYPKLDGDNIKALYVLNAAPLVAVLAGVALERMARKGVLLGVGVALALVAVAIPTVDFLLLRG
jgi:hypothetical protein